MDLKIFEIKIVIFIIVFLKKKKRKRKETIFYQIFANFQCTRILNTIWDNRLSNIFNPKLVLEFQVLKVSDFT